MKKKGDIVFDQLTELIERQAVLAANLEVTKYIISSLYSRQKVRDAENPNLRHFQKLKNSCSILESLLNLIVNCKNF